MSQLAVSKSNDGDKWNFHTFSCGSDTRQHPIHLDRVREFENHFVYQLILADRSRDWRHFRIRRHLRNEPFRIELAQFVAAHAAGEHWYVIYISNLDHSCECVLGITSGELVPHMVLPQFAQSFLGRA